MPLLRPFAGVGVKPENIASFTSSSLDNYSKDEIIKRNRLIRKSFIGIVFPTIDDAIKKIETKFKKVRKNFEKLVETKYLIKDQRSIYLYEQIKPNGENYKGIICLTSLADYKNGSIKKHEGTLKEREELFSNYLKSVHFQAEPVLLTYPENSKIDLLLEFEMRGQHKYKWLDENGIQHKLWKIDNHLKINQFKESIDKLDALYIADGHHRISSTEIYGDFMKSQEDQWTGNEPYNFILSFIISNTSLNILEYNRLIKDLNGLSKEEFLNKISENFTVIPKGEELYYPSHKHHISMYLDGEFYGLYVNHNLRDIPPGIGELDIYLFEEYLLKPILNIKDTNHDKRINFLKGTKDKRGIKELKEKVDCGLYKVAFAFFPINFKELKKVSDLNQIMPPKSTYIEPKLQSGVILFDTKF